MNQQENPLRAYQDLPPGERKRAGVYFDAAAALACLLCAGLTFYLAGFDQPAETAVFFAAAGTVVVGLHHAVSEPTIHRRRYAGTAAVVAIFAAVLSGGSLLGGTPSTDRFTMVLLAYLWPVLLACWLVLLARRLRAWLRGEEISAQTAAPGWCAVLVDGLPLGGGKVSGGRVKNHYPKALRNLK